MAERLTLAFLLAAAAVLAASAVDTKLTLQNLCPLRVYPLVTANELVSFPFPDTFWAGSVVARICKTPTSCETVSAPPVTVVKLAVHSPEAGHGQDLATYSVSLAEGFNVAAVVTPLFSGGGQCPALGCLANLTDGCPVDQLVIDHDCRVAVACKGDPGYFKRRCPLTRVNDGDREPVPQNCLAPRENKVVFCPIAISASAQTELLVRDY